MRKMKKEKSSKGQKKSAPERSGFPQGDARLNDFGLEPPKIYRESQRKAEGERIRRSNTSVQNNKNITTAQRRTKQTKKRRKKNKLRRIVISVFVAVFAVAVLLAVSLTSFFNITAFTVKGTEKYSKAEITDSLTVKIGDRMFLSDFDKAEEHLKKSLPYVYEVTFKRKLPSTVEIQITDAETAYCIANKDKTYILLDNNFKVLEKKAKKPSGIKIKKAAVKSVREGVIITFENKKISNCLADLGSAVESGEFTEITALYSLGLNQNYAVYDNRITFKLGTCDDLEKKLYRGFAACDKLNQSNPNAKGEMNLTTDKQIYFTEK